MLICLPNEDTPVKPCALGCLGGYVLSPRVGSQRGLGAAPAVGVPGQAPPARCGSWARWPTAVFCASVWVLGSWSPPQGSLPGRSRHTCYAKSPAHDQPGLHGNTRL